MRQCKALAVVFASAFAISGASSTQDFMVEPGAFLVHTRVGIVDAFAPTSEHGTQHLCGHLRATLHCEPYAAGSHGAVQDV